TTHSSVARAQSLCVTHCWRQRRSRPHTSLSGQSELNTQLSTMQTCNPLGLVPPSASSGTTQRASGTMQSPLARHAWRHSPYEHVSGSSHSLLNMHILPGTGVLRSEQPTAESSVHVASVSAAAPPRMM